MLFLADVDGCLAEPYRPYNLDVLRRVAEAIRVPGHPPFALLTGRAYGYAEAFAQLLGLTAPAFFEAGAGAFLLPEARTVWHPAVTDDALAALDEVRRWFFAELLPAVPGLVFDHGKRAQVGAIGPDVRQVQEASARTRRFVDDLGAPLTVFETHVSVDVLVHGLTKGDALDWIAELTGTPVDRMAFIGDSEGDVGALRRVGFPYAPANATAAVQAVAETMPQPLAEGVLEAYVCYAKLR
ncbi:MAG: HAD hydrolase family protein [Bacteroidetes bacterium]|nr:HAD hydrolase family protein [Bacteroidota bacterium]